MAIQTGIGLSTQKDPALAAKEALQEAWRNIHHAKVDLIIAFSSINLSSELLLRTTGNYFPQARVLGASGAAVICGDGIFKHGLIVMLISFPESEKIYFNTACVKDISKKSAFEAGKELGESLLYGSQGIRRDLSLVFSDGLLRSSSDFILGLQEKLGRSFPLVGASSSDNLTFEKTYVYFNQELLTNAACGILLGGRLTFGLGTRHGWKALGKPRQVTKSSGNIVHEIDNAPAIKIYEDYFAKDKSALAKELKRISILYPIGIYLTGEDEFLLRNISSVEEDGSIVFAGDVPQESQIRLMIGTKETALSAAQQAADEAKKELSGRPEGRGWASDSPSHRPCAFALIFDSVSRYILLGRQANKELEIIKNSLGKDTPLIGLYTYGEQAPLKALNYLGRTYFHNQTINILAVGG